MTSGKLLVVINTKSSKNPSKKSKKQFPSEAGISQNKKRPIPEKISILKKIAKSRGKPLFITLK